MIEQIKTPDEAQLTPPPAPPELKSASISLPPLLPDSAKSEPAPSAYGHSATLWISPRLLRYILPATVVATFVFLFLPWTGAYPSGFPAYTQSAFQTIWGGVTIDQLAADSLDSSKPYDKVEKDPFMLFYVLAIFLALILVLSPLVLSAARVQSFRPIVRSIWQRREAMLRTIALGTFAILMIQQWAGFGFEAAVAAKAEQNQSAEVAAAKTSEAKEKAVIHRGAEVSPLNLTRTLWFRLAVLSNAMFLLAVGLEIWLKWRGTRPLPRIDLHE